MLFILHIYTYMGFSGGSDGKESACNAGDPGLIPGLGRSPGEGNSYPLQPTVYGVAQSQTQLKQLSMHAHKIFSSISYVIS